MKKKLLALFLSVACAASVVCAFSGCGEESDIDDEEREIEYTAVAPVYELDSITCVEKNVVFEYYHHTELDDENQLVEYDFYEVLKTYYACFKFQIDDSFYLLNPGDGITYGIPYQSGGSKFFMYDDPLIYEYVQLNDEALGAVTDKPQEDILYGGSPPYNIELHLILLPVDNNVKENNFTLEFGTYQYESYGKLHDRYYINIYVGDVAVATCFYWVNTASEYYTTENINLTYKWFKNYFKTNLKKE